MPVDAVFVALADATRRQVLEVLGSRPAASASALARELPVSRQAVLKHLAVLEQSGLVTNAREGREVMFRVRAQPLYDAATWLTGVAEQWEDRLGRLKRAAESDT